MIGKRQQVLKVVPIAKKSSTFSLEACLSSASSSIEEFLHANTPDCYQDCYHVYMTLQHLSKGVITLAKKRNGWRVKCDKGPGVSWTTSNADDDRISLSLSLTLDKCWIFENLGSVDWSPLSHNSEMGVER